VAVKRLARELAASDRFPREERLGRRRAAALHGKRRCRRDALRALSELTALLNLVRLVATTMRREP